MGSETAWGRAFYDPQKTMEENFARGTDKWAKGAFFYPVAVGPAVRLRGHTPWEGGGMGGGWGTVGFRGQVRHRAYPFTSLLWAPECTVMSMASAVSLKSGPRSRWGAFSPFCPHRKQGLKEIINIKMNVLATVWPQCLRTLGTCTALFKTSGPISPYFDHRMTLSYEIYVSHTLYNCLCKLCARDLRFTYMDGFFVVKSVWSSRWTCTSTLSSFNTVNVCV